MGRRIPCVEEAMDCRSRRGWNGGSVGSACREYDVLGRWWEMVTPLGLLLRLTLGGNDGVERFCSLQPGIHVGQDACETHMVL